MKVQRYKFKVHTPYRSIQIDRQFATSQHRSIDHQIQRSQIPCNCLSPIGGIESSAQCSAAPSSPWAACSRCFTAGCSEPALGRSAGRARPGVAVGCRRRPAGGAVALRRSGASAFRGRRAIAVWLLATLLHAPATAGERIGHDSPALPEAVTAVIADCRGLRVVGLGLVLLAVLAGGLLARPLAAHRPALARV